MTVLPILARPNGTAANLADVSFDVFRWMLEVSNLNPTSAGIAEYFKSIGAKGEPSNHGHCPLSNTVSKQLGGAYKVRVSGKELDIIYGVHSATIPLPRVWQRFIYEYDRLYYSELVAVDGIGPFYE